MDFFTIIFIILAVMVIAFVLGLRDKANARKNLIDRLKKEYGSAPHIRCKSGERERISGFYRNHKEGFRIDDITWNDLDMDALFRIIDNTCSQNGGEYLYDMLRRPLVSPEEEALLKERGREVFIWVKNITFLLILLIHG